MWLPNLRNLRPAQAPIFDRYREKRADPIIYTGRLKIQLFGRSFFRPALNIEITPLDLSIQNSLINARAP